MVQVAISVNDFDSILDNYAGQQLSHTPITRTKSNVTNEETLTDGSPVNIKAYFMRTAQNWDFAKAGFLEKGDAVMLAKVVDGVVKDDKITFKSQVFRVKEAFNVPGTFDSTGSGTVYVYTACNLFLES